MACSVMMTNDEPLIVEMVADTHEADRLGGIRNPEDALQRFAERTNFDAMAIDIESAGADGQAAGTRAPEMAKSENKDLHACQPSETWRDVRVENFLSKVNGLAAVQHRYGETKLFLSLNNSEHQRERARYGTNPV